MRVLFTAIVPLMVYAGSQNPDSLTSIVSENEYLLEEESADQEESLIVEEEEERGSHRVDLNTASFAELRRIPSLTPVLAYRIMVWRRERPFTRVEELLEIDGMNNELMVLLRPFIRISEKKPTEVRLRTRYQIDTPRKKGFEGGIYRGSRVRWYQRSAFTSGLGSAGSDGITGAMVLEKDPGERWMNSHSAGYLRADLEVLGASVLLGDFTAASGGGLAFGFPGRSFAGTSLSFESPARMRGYASTIEDHFFRGVALQARPAGSVALLGFFSSRSVHATKNSQGEITRFDDAGLFRTEGEEQRRFAAEERVVGGEVRLEIPVGISFALKGVTAQYHPPMSGGAGSPVFGADISLTHSRGRVFFEAVGDKDRNLAALAGAEEIIDRAVRVGVLASWSPEGFKNRHLSPTVRRGTSLWFDLRPGSSLRMRGTYDFLSSAETSVKSFSIDQGDRLRLLLHLRLSGTASLELLLRRTTQALRTRRGDVLQRASFDHSEQTRHNIRAEVLIRRSAILQLRSRIEVTMLDSRASGILVSQLVKWRMVPWLEWEARGTVFETRSFESRLYQFERDVPGVFRNAALFGSGLRSSVLAAVSIGTAGNVFVSYAVLVKHGLRSLGSGWDETPGDQQGRVTLQTELKL